CLVEDLLGRPVRVALRKLIVGDSALREMVLERLYRCHAHGPSLGPPVACADASVDRLFVQVAKPDRSAAAAGGMREQLFEQCPRPLPVVRLGACVDVSGGPE